MLQSERVIKRANLPDNSVSLVAVGIDYSDTIKALESLNIRVLRVNKNILLPDNYSDHPDLHICHYGQNVLFTNDKESAGELSVNFSPVIIREVPGNKYPNDVSTNAVRLGNYLICNKKTF